MTCKDCLGNMFCNKKDKTKRVDKYCADADEICDNFKDKSRYIELLYHLETKVFVIRQQTSDKNSFYIFEDYITGYIYGKYGFLMTFDYHLS